MYNFISDSYLNICNEFLYNYIHLYKDLQEAEDEKI